MTALPTLPKLELLQWERLVHACGAPAFCLMHATTHLASTPHGDGANAIVVHSHCGRADCLDCDDHVALKRAKTVTTRSSGTMHQAVLTVPDCLITQVLLYLDEIHSCIRGVVERALRAYYGVSCVAGLYILFHPTGDKNPRTARPHWHVWIDATVYDPAIDEHVALDIDVGRLQALVIAEWRKTLGVALSSSPRQLQHLHRGTNVSEARTGDKLLFSLRREARTFPHWSASMPKAMRSPKVLGILHRGAKHRLTEPPVKKKSEYVPFKALSRGMKLRYLGLYHTEHDRYGIHQFHAGESWIGGCWKGGHPRGCDLLTPSEYYSITGHYHEIESLNLFVPAGFMPNPSGVAGAILSHNAAKAA